MHFSTMVLGKLILIDFRRIAGPLVAQFPLSNRLNLGAESVRCWRHYRAVDVR